jgi:hypothetical protein
MSRFIPSLALALGCAAIAVNAQETTTRTTTKSSGGEVKTVTYTGCVQTGTQARSYVLDKVVPVSKTTTSDVTGATSTTTTYLLVPGERVEVQQHVGQKVEVTGMLIPAGDVKTETKTEIERDDAKDTKTKETVKSDNATAQFRVTSIKALGEACSS